MALVSIVMPMYNSAPYLSMAISSVIQQTYKKWELILVDDCSNDESVSIANEFCKRDDRIKLITLNKNMGAANARNKGVDVARGRFISFLDSDDIWLPMKLNIQVDFMLKHDFSFTYTAYNKIDQAGKKIFSLGVADSLKYQDLLKCCTIGCLTVMYDTRYLGKLYFSTATKREDYALWLYILREKNVIANGINNVLACYRVYPTQSSAKKITMAIENWKLLREQENLSFVSAVYYFSQYAIRGILRDKYPRQAKKIGIINEPVEFDISFY
ncbi:glycosyltransferase family 2 protein [Edwardsiella tarda]|uniref:glycosyltransferase family 2 protein n=1 Tax=Edwardsiella tarda TaxID=636 RepID=UPI00351C16F2